MTAKKWLIMFSAAVLSALILLAALNLIVDPFGVFGDRVFDWYSYNFTTNPQAAKITYLEKNKGEFDSFVVGSSTASAYSTAQLNGYTGGSYYNMFSYGADMEKNLHLVKYLIDNYDVKSIVLPLGLREATVQNEEETLNNLPNPAVSGNAFLFYTKYIFADPRNAAAKLTAYSDDSYLPKPFDVFTVETGMYDKSVRDVEYIGGMDGYLAANPTFTALSPYSGRLDNIAGCAENLAEIRALCDEKGVLLTVIFSPEYYAEKNNYPESDIEAFRAAVAAVTDYWDFSFSTASDDARYFYDEVHIRNALGDMVLARIFENKNVYYPPDFGVLIKRGEAAALPRYGEFDYTADIPIILYHHFAETGSPSTVVSREQFAENMATLSNAGYTAITPAQLVGFVDKGIDLPEKPIMITLDDGYYSNYEIAYPILRSYDLSATIFTIGVSNGKDLYKETGVPITPHFGDAEMLEMVQSGVISIQSHTYDMHQSPELDMPCRTGVLPMDDEPEAAYITALREDIKRSISDIEASTGEPVIAFAFPGGVRDTLADVLLWEAGIRVTFTTQTGVNTIVKGLPQSLLGLKRFNIEGGVTGAQLLEMLEKR